VLTESPTPTSTTPGSTLHDEEPPWCNGYIESFNSRVRDECLNINMFWSLAQARVVISDWKADYNHHRRHSALGYQAPAVYAAARTHP
jgi:transposase InsO family protein